MTSTTPPDVNTLVEIVHDGREFPSRVEDGSGTVLTLAAPLGGTLEPPEPGSVFRLRWSAGPRGRYLAQFRLIDIVRGTVSVWNAEMVGEAVVEQRRRFVRSGGSEPVQVRGEEAAAGETVNGRIINISEGGIRCILHESALTERQAVSVTMRLDDRILAVEGQILRTTRGETPKETIVVIVLDLTESDAGIVRRYVMQQQILARRRATSGAQ
jgi:hypothetical protein